MPSLSRLSTVLFDTRMPADLQGRFRTNSLALASVLGLVACPLLAAVFTVLGADWQVWAMVPGVLGILAVIRDHRRTGRVGRSLNLLMGVYFAIISFYAYSLGGISSAAAWWFIVPPYVTVMCALPRATLGWCAAGLGALGSLYALEEAGHAFVLMEGAAEASLYFVSLVLLSALLLSFLSLLGQSRERTLAYVEKRNAELREARDTALAAAQVKAQFLANMSHEIRTPLNGVLGMAELLDRSPLNGEQSRFLATLRDSGEHLLCLIDDVLDYSRLEARSVVLAVEPFSPRELVERVAAAMRVEASTKGLMLLTQCADDLPARVLGDPARLRQILFKLLANAVKFTQTGQVTLALHAAGKGADGRMALAFAVSDTGIGIEAGDLARLCTAFAQADGSHTRAYGGVGLGLAISQALARLMHGELEIDSAPGRGTHVRCVLQFAPCADADAALHASAVGRVADAAGPAVLLVEDNPVNLEVGLAMLEQLDCRVSVAHDGTEALGCWREEIFDLALMDCQMPVMDGFVATREIRAAERAGKRRRLPIVALTANVLREDREACFAAGMDDFLAKPYTLAQLADILARHVPRREAA